MRRYLGATDDIYLTDAEEAAKAAADAGLSATVVVGPAGTAGKSVGGFTTFQTVLVIAGGFLIYKWYTK